MASRAGVVVKNTFLEVGEHTSLQQRSDGWRRQMSEPAKIYTESSHFGSGQDNGSEFGDEDDESFADLIGQVADAMGIQDGAAPIPASSSSSGPLSQMPVSPMVGRQWPDDLAAAAAMMSASMMMPPSQQAQMAQQFGQHFQASAPQQKAGGGGAHKKGDGRQGHMALNQLKNNDITSKEPPWNDVTTVMMRNLPNKYRQQMLLDELQDVGFRLAADFDFFYLPMDHSNAANLGYCFINFVETKMANAFAAAFQGKKMRRFNSHKTVVVMPASIQGYERNYRYYSSTRVAMAEDPAYRPLFLKHGSEPLAGQAQEEKRGGGGKGSGADGPGSQGKGEAPGGSEKGGRGGGKKGGKDKAGRARHRALMPVGSGWFLLQMLLRDSGKGVEALGGLRFMGLDQAAASSVSGVQFQSGEVTGLESRPVLSGEVNSPEVPFSRGPAQSWTEERSPVWSQAQSRSEEANSGKFSVLYFVCPALLGSSSLPRARADDPVY
ncbi:unnamed protein product [Polarella glacialis]|uniref:Mei2-like C-terminal RNA recognition motif domain-containing protein n=1 Tax=Polarella glacialis TaxID=89957 RepID=A0A813JLL2_POLGL|nr:unnamed protein product [Polarella glacialis]